MFKIVSAILVASVLGCAAHKAPLSPISAGKMAANSSIDMRGKRITSFIVYQAAITLNNMEQDQILDLITDRYEPIDQDINAWSRMTGNRVVESEQAAEYQRYYIQKAQTTRHHKQLAMVISNPGLEELLSPLGFALAGALEGSDVYLYFQGPAVRVLTKGFKEQLHGINSLFSGFARDELSDIGHVPAQEKLRQLTELGAHIYVCGPSMEHFGVRKEDIIFKQVIVAEYLTFMEVMQKSDIHIFLQ